MGTPLSVSSDQIAVVAVVAVVADWLRAYSGA
jgi:hypothetical protein